MDISIKLCSSCGFSFQTNGYLIGGEQFCSSKCLPNCGFCHNSEDLIGYCSTNKTYYCLSCNQKRCKYCNTYMLGSKCPKKCD